MPFEIGEPRTRAAEEAGDVSDERKVPAVAFLECVKVYYVELADINTDGGRAVRVRVSI